MDLSGSFKSIMTSLFPNAVIIADKFHYTRNVGYNLTQARIQFCKSIVKKDYFKKHLTNKALND